MSCLLTSGRIDPCKDNVGGVKAVYLTEFDLYQPYEYTIVNNELTSFPYTGVWKLDTRPDGNSFTEAYDGESLWSQSLTLQLNGLSLEMHELIAVLNRTDVRVIVEMNNGLIKIMGLHNGMSVDSQDTVMGSKHTDFNGYSLKLSATELRQAPYISDITAVGFVVIEGNIHDFHLQNYTIFDLQDGSEFDLQSA